MGKLFVFYVSRKTACQCGECRYDSLWRVRPVSREKHAMYDLMVTAQEDAWTGQPYEFDLSRVIRSFTEDEIREKYKPLDAKAVAELQSFPTLFAYEGPLEADARIGFITAVRKRGDRVKIE